MQTHRLLGLLVLSLGALAWGNDAHAIPCGIAFPCPSDVFQITDANGNIVNDINGNPVNYTFTEVSESTVSIVAPQIPIGAGSVSGTVYLTEGPPALTGLTQVSDVITATTSGGIATFTFQSDGQTVPLNYVDCTTNPCVAETGTGTGQPLQDLSSYFTMSGISLKVLVQSDVGDIPNPQIFWTDNVTVAVGAAKLDGTFVNQDFITGPYLGVAFDGTYIYWVNQAGTIGRSTLDRTSVNQSFISATALGVAVDESYIYWANNVAGAIGRANRDGTGVNESLITGLTGSSTPGQVAVDGTYIYWAPNTNSPGSIGRANRDGTGVNQSFIPGLSGVTGIAVDRFYIYWTNNFASTIGRANRDGTGVNQLFMPIPGDSFGLADDGTYIYWTNYEMHSIGRANRDGTGANQSFIPGLAGPGGGPGQIAVSVDTDSDGIPDQLDNCPFVPNGPSLGTCVGTTVAISNTHCHTNADCGGTNTCDLSQTDRGGFGSGSPPDGVGDVCQCGDVNNDGVVDNSDATAILRAVANLAPYGATGVANLPSGVNKCDVNGDGLCNNNDVIAIKRKIAGLTNGYVAGTCHDATTYP